MKAKAYIVHRAMCEPKLEWSKPKDCLSAEPLYTSPPAQRRPLTITEESAWDLARYVYARSNPHESPQILLSAMELKQIIEAAHGITGEKK